MRITFVGGPFDGMPGMALVGVPLHERVKLVWAGRQVFYRLDPDREGVYRFDGYEDAATVDTVSRAAPRA